MDSMKSQPNAVMKGWRALFGGNQIEGRTKLFGFLLAFILIGGVVFALLL